MRVVTLTPSLLSAAAAQLSRRIRAAQCHPTLIVGIRHGGAEVARLMRDDFADTVYCEVQISRPDTSHKGHGWLHAMLQHLPQWLCDVLRMAESRINEWRSRSAEPQRICDVTLTPEATAALQAASHMPVILLVDDAIDTGATIMQARQRLLQQHPTAQIMVAVITVTTQHPLCDADFCLYHDRTLCRFPWSNDYKPKA